ncbi:fibrinogen C domain-containing protein 1-like [Actinia tenebrosa]|uniref:Fibrinogen C domain-containing protein 1-like n=1 Tax=Actinia tenebrosa TaxID=6105 RepID=A0A6P8J778_ACTTE|nr:fibrinogen C domain-containing protein 1-like [Actinia tenebrosa]
MKSTILALVVLFLSIFSAEGVGKNVRKIQNKHGCLVQNFYHGGPNNFLVMKYLQMMNKKLNYLMKRVKSCEGGGEGGNNCKKVPKNCAEVLKCGGKKSGIYKIKPDSKAAFKVYCDQKTNGGGWVVIQKRKDGSVNFFRGWTDYKNGFGALKGEFWLGLDKIFRLTHQTRNRLRVELEDTKGNTAYAEYSFFAVSSEPNKYRLSLGTYSGTAGDSLSGHRNAPFSTKDRDNDAHSSGNCAVSYKGAWWYTSCHGSNLNGLYHHGVHKSYADGVNWKTWKGYYFSAKRAEMKIRPA